MDEFSRHGIIAFDEMKLSEHIDVKSSGYLEGFADLGQFGEENSSEELADHGLVVVFQPFSGKWMQILGVFSSKSNVKANVLAKIVLEATLLCEQAGLFVDGVTSQHVEDFRNKRSRTVSTVHVNVSRGQDGIATVAVMSSDVEKAISAASVKKIESAARAEEVAIALAMAWNPRATVLTDSQAACRNFAMGSVGPVAARLVQRHPPESGSSVETRKKVAEGSILNSPSGARETSKGRWYNRWPEEALRVRTGRCVSRRVGLSKDPRPSGVNEPDDGTMGGRATQGGPEPTATAGPKAGGAPE
ncbi:hypothetical protein HPB47_005403 [Ixodes persulcatus]|uniref:Uncharacterized protein n=1 Tax=Ixodes persulcatus TaxID=34615 RepID=A0AC60PD07_IXOPE|nr:hypothetical protein HPB47_005403 [Ixodes persulcatus]